MVRLRKVINRAIHLDEDGVQVDGGVNAVVAANVGEGSGSRTGVSSTQRIVQRSGRRSRSATKRRSPGHAGG